MRPVEHIASRVVALAGRFAVSAVSAAFLAVFLAVFGVGFVASTPGSASAAPRKGDDAGDGEAVGPVVRQAIERALSVAGARLDSAVIDRAAARGIDCRADAAEILRPIDGSARVAVKLSGHSARGQRCDAWIWVRVRVVAPVAVAARALAPGERIEGAVSVEERELRPGHAPASIGSATVAAHALAAGQMIEAAVVIEPTLRPGESVKVIVVSGSLMIEQAGRGVPCARGRSCAKLDSGKQVEGDLVAGRLVVQSQ